MDFILNLHLKRAQRDIFLVEPEIKTSVQKERKKNAAPNFKTFLDFDI